MAYQETEKTRAHREAQRGLIIASAADIIAKEGFHALTAKAIVARAGVSMGKIFFYFPDMTELVAAVEVTVMHRDRATIEAASRMAGARAVVGAFSAVFDIFATKAISRELMTHSEAYRDTLAKALGHVIGASELCERNEVRNAARAALGALFGMAAASGPRAPRLSRALLFVLRGLGVSEKKAVE